MRIGRLQIINWEKYMGFRQIRIDKSKDTSYKMFYKWAFLFGYYEIRMFKSKADIEKQYKEVWK